MYLINRVELTGSFLLCSSLFLQVAYYSFLIYWYNIINGDLQNSADGYDVVAQTSSYLSSATNFTKFWSEVFIFLTLTRFAAGIAIARKHKNSITTKRWYKIGTYAIAALLFILAVVSFALSCNFYSVVLSHGISQTYLASDDYLSRLLQMRQMTFATTVVFFAAALALLGFCIRVAVDATKAPKVPLPASNYLLVSSILWVLQTAYDMCNYAYYTDFSGQSDGRTYQAYSEILEIIFNWWPMFIILTLLFSIGFLKQEGLFSKHQSWMPNEEHHHHHKHKHSDESNGNGAHEASPSSNTPQRAWPPQHYNKEKDAEEGQPGFPDLKHSATAS